MPAYPAGDFHKADQEFYAKLQAHFAKYHDLMEQVKLKDSLRTAMDYSSECNLYFQENKPWELAKASPERCA